MMTELGGWLFHLDVRLRDLKSAGRVRSRSWINFPLLYLKVQVNTNWRILTLIHFLDDRTELVTVAMDCRLHLLELALTHCMLVGLRIWVVVLLVHVSLVWTRYLHSVHVLNDHLLVLRCKALLVTRVVTVPLPLFLIWIAGFLNILHRRSLLALYVECRLTDWLAATVQLKIGLLRRWLSQLRFRLSSHWYGVLVRRGVVVHLHMIGASVALVDAASSLHVSLLTRHCMSWVVWCHGPFLLLGSKLFLSAKFPLTHVIRISSYHALLMNGVSDCLRCSDSMSVGISALLLFVNVLSHASLLLGWQLIFLLLAILSRLLWRLRLLGADLGASHGLGSLWCILFRASNRYRGINFVRHASPVDTLILGHNLLEGLIVEVATTFLFRRFVYGIRSWSPSSMSCLKTLSFLISRAW